VLIEHGETATNRNIMLIELQSEIETKSMIIDRLISKHKIAPESYLDFLGCFIYSGVLLPIDAILDSPEEESVYNELKTSLNAK
jgi:hypothetical protein